MKNGDKKERPCIFQSALQTIFNAVMYVFARDGKVPDEFSAEQLRGAMRQL